MSRGRLLAEWWSCAAVLAAFGLGFGDSSFLLTVATLALVQGLLAVSINIVQGLAGQVSLAQAGLMAVAAYTAAYLTGTRHWPVPGALAVAVVLCVLTGFAVAVVTVRFRDLMHFAIATLGFSLILQGVLSGSGAVGGTSGLPVTYALPGLPLVPGDRVLAAQAAIMRSRVGHAFVGIRENHLLAASLGIQAARYRILAMTIGAVPAALAGILFGYAQTFISPDDFGLTLTVNVIVMTVVGGAGTLAGPLLGAALFGVAPQILSISGEARSGIFGVLLIVIVIYVPGGLLGLACLAIGRCRLAAGGAARPRREALWPSRTAAPPESDP
jgi:branched-chain amino acid transport system permease protein